MSGSDSAPWSEFAELSALGCLLLGDDPARRAVELVPVEAFHLPRHRVVFRAARRILARGEPVDVVTLSDELKSAGELEAAGGMGYLAQLVDAAPSAQGLETWAAKLRERWSLRETARVLREEMDQALENGAGDPSDLWSRLEARIGDLREVHGERAATDEEDPTVPVTLASALEKSDRQGTPEAVVPRFAWRGRLTLFAGFEKEGKSTRGAAGIARATASGHTALLAALEEHRDDPATRLDRFGADPDRTYVVGSASLNPVRKVEGWIEHLRPDLLVVDTLYALVEPLAIESGDATAWTQVMQGLRRVASKHGTAVVLIHHARKSDGRYRDSTAIGAGVDMLLEATRGEDQSTLEVTCRGRWYVPDHTLVLTGTEANPRMELLEGERSLEERVLDFVRLNPGSGTNDVKRGVTGDTAEIGTLLQVLERQGKLENRKEGRRHSWHPAEQMRFTGANQRKPPETTSETGAE